MSAENRMLYIEDDEGFYVSYYILMTTIVVVVKWFHYLRT